MLLVNQIKLPLGSNAQSAIEAAQKQIGLRVGQIKAANIAKVSVDARHGTPALVYTVAFEMQDEPAFLAKNKNIKNVSYKQRQTLCFEKPTQKLSYRPIVCGCGPAGLFAALLLAQKGFCPIVLERGQDIPHRMAAIERFNAGGILDVNTNVQFGEGGAGTFSDGKLTTRINDPLCDFITETLLMHGAPKEIAWQQKPHIGTDLLRDVIASIRNEIIALGGTVHFETKLTGLVKKQGRLAGVQTTNGEIPCEALVLAIGHSARDTFAMLKEQGVALQAKPFSVGFRAEHLQTEIDKALYHSAAGHPALPKGEYQLSSHVNGRCVYSFCMCPGGNVVAASSEENTVVTNGMSYHARDGKNANAAVVVSVNENDFNGDAMQAIAFQQKLEQHAFLLGGGNYTAPAQNIQSFLAGTAQLNTDILQPTYPRGVTAADMSVLFGEELTGALQAGLRSFNTKIKGYTAPEAILTGVETRTSSPVRIARDSNYMSADIKGLYPTGEGAGYAGGIISAAVDGVRVAKSMIDTFLPPL
ncbi:MAG: FAD-dependent oxidoreductase [Oscillospiraceae bacterium]|nr:FAD-dependent oxidoreductase [Oscillospiraceae bacterium]